MSPPQAGISLTKKAYAATYKSLKNNPALFIPFLIFAVIECLALILIYLAPRLPLRLVFGPPIRTFWGERFLHYPMNFILIPKLTSLAKMGLTVVLGSLLTGIAVAITADIYNKKHLKLPASFKAALKQYINLFIVVFIFTLLFYFSVKLITIGMIRYFLSGHSRLLFLGPGVWAGVIFPALNFLLALFIQSVFIYAIPVLIIEKAGAIQSIGRSCILFKRLLIPTLLLVGLPMLIYIPAVVMEHNSAFLITKIFPEFILFVSFFGIIISSLVIDPAITISATFLYLINKEKQN